MDVGDQLAKLNLSYVPMEITINRHENGKVSYGDKLGELESVAIEESKVYQLYGVCSTINDAPNGQPHNIVAAINVGPFYHSRIASAVSTQYEITSRYMTDKCTALTSGQPMVHSQRLQY